MRHDLGGYLDRHPLGARAPRSGTRRRPPALLLGRVRRAFAPRVKAIGVDIVPVDHMNSVLERHPGAVEAIFTDAEIGHSRRAANSGERFAARFAAKEAVLKALGTGMARGMTWTDIEVRTTASGRPVLHLHGAVARRAALLGLETWQLSLSHGRGVAVAYVVGSGPESPGPPRREGTRRGTGKDNDDPGNPLPRHWEAA